jgi:hypothetical protein
VAQAKLSMIEDTASGLVLDTGPLADLDSRSKLGGLLHVPL